VTWPKRFPCLLPPPTEQHDLGLASLDRGTSAASARAGKADPAKLPDALRAQWRRLAPEERLVYFKLITGSFRVGVSRLQVTQALAAVGGIDAKRVAQRLMGYTHITGQPSAADYAALIAAESSGELNQKTSGQPYPFFLAHPFNIGVDQFDAVLGPPADWLVEWKWDGIRAQLVKRAGQVWLWSRGEELVTDRFPELATMGEALPDGTVLDGEIVVWREDKVQPFAELQKRIGRKTLSPKLLQDIPVVLLAYDLLEWQGRDLRATPQAERRVLMDDLVTQLQHPQLIASPMLTARAGRTWHASARPPAAWVSKA
jgi:DNA ligase-1